MIITSIARHARHAGREMDRCAAWKAAMERLREDWRNEGGISLPDLPSYLEKVPGSQRAEAVQDLVAGHLRLSWQAGTGTCLEAYLGMLLDEQPAWISVSDLPADLVEDEFLARHQLPHGDTPDVAEYEKRFASRPDVLESLEQRCLGAGRYVKLERCGQGAMGDVWKACDRRLRRIVAIKTPKMNAGDADWIRRQFSEEARIGAELEHPGIGSVHEHDPDSDPPFCVLRWIEGHTLAERIHEYHHPQAIRSSSDRKVLWLDLLSSFVAACDAVAYAHSRGVLHCDLKPGNILTGDFGETLVLDWGLARRAVQAPRVLETGGGTAGTPEYMAPEQADGRADARSDVFGLGAILFEILTGRPPRQWPGGCRPDDWPAIVRGAALPSPRHLEPRTSRAIEAICLKALARIPSERHEGAAALSRDMRRHIAGAPVTARASSSLSGLLRLPWRRRL